MEDLNTKTNKSRRDRCLQSVKHSKQCDFQVQQPKVLTMISESSEVVLSVRSTHAYARI